MNNRNNGRKIAVRLFALRDFLYANADTEHAVTVDEIMEYYQSREFENTSIKTVYWTRTSGLMRVKHAALLVPQIRRAMIQSQRESKRTVPMAFS